LEKAQHTTESESILSANEFSKEKFENSKPLLIQPKLSVGAADDPFEHEADAMADRVMRMPDTSFIQRKCASCEEEEKIHRKLETTFLQRKCAACEHEEEEQIHRKITPFIQKQGSGLEGGTASESVTNQINSSRAGGNRMSENTLSFMESRFNTDFSGVKIHTDSNAVQMSRELNAQAFTVGSDIYFNSGKYAPESDSGRHLLAHELTHTVQQGGGVKRKVQRQEGVTITTPAPTSPSESRTPPVPAVPTYGEACIGGSSDPCQSSRCGTHHSSIQADFNRASSYVSSAIAVLSGTLTSSQNDTMDWYFNSHTQEVIYTVSQRLNCIKTVIDYNLANNLYGCHPDYDALAYVCAGSYPPCSHVVRKVCLTNQHFSNSSRTRAETIIHECSHLAGMSLGQPNSVDDIYEFNTAFSYMDTSESTMNADKYALFASAIVNGVRLNHVPSLRLSYGVAVSDQNISTWQGSLYLGTEFQHPVLGVFNPTLGLGMSLMGIPETPATHITPTPSLLISLLPGITITDPRPTASGTGYVSFMGGPSLAVGSTVGFGAEVGMNLGYRWRMIDFSVGVGYQYNPTRPTGLENMFTLSGGIMFNMGALIPGSH
jgi:hypothetical protein